jgi:Fic family protein
MRFFLLGVAQTAEEATMTAQAVVGLREEHRIMIHDSGIGANALRLLDLLFQRPLVTVGLVQTQLNLADTTASRLLERFANLNLVDEITGYRRNKVFRYTPYWRLFQPPVAANGTQMPPQATESET